MSQPFKNARKGDTVYDLDFGYGVVLPHSLPLDVRYPIRVQLHSGGRMTYTLEGRRDMAADTPQLYWGKPDIIAPPEPPRYRTGWVCGLVDKETGKLTTGWNSDIGGDILFATRDKALDMARSLSHYFDIGFLTEVTVPELPDAS